VHDCQQRTEDDATKVTASLETLEQFAAPNTTGDVVDPKPEAIFDPLQIGLGPVSGSPARGPTEHVWLAFPQDDPFLDAVLEIAKGDELEVDM